MNVLQLIRRYERTRRFWRNVRVDDPADCWRWLGRTDADGRGVHAGRPAHELAYALTSGPPPPGASLAHRCGNRWCVNPRHLELRSPGSP
jgi:hypothetical protein